MRIGKTRAQQRNDCELWTVNSVLAGILIFDSWWVLEDAVFILRERVDCWQRMVCSSEEILDVVELCIQ